VRAAFADGWWFGVGFFGTGLYWIAFALLTDAPRFGWMVPFALIGMAGGLALFVGLAAAVLRRSGTTGTPRILLFAALWTAAEYARGHVLTGFPWNLVAQTWMFSEASIQAASILGAYGLSMLTVLAAAAPALWLEKSDRTRWAGPVAAALIPAVLWSFGTARLADAEPENVPGISLRVVQPNIEQSTKWQRGLRDSHLAKTLTLTREPGWREASHVIWPETAIPFFIARDAPRRELIAHAVPPAGALIAGAPRLDNGENGLRRVWNSLHVFDPAGAVIGTYDKFHLVPFGEYVPLRAVLPIDKITAGAGDFSAGPGLATLTAPGLPPFSPLICYEAIFPGAVAADNAPPAWLLNITHDAWFGITAGPHQHFAAVRLRAVEEGLPLVRAANNGISAVVDAYGRVRESLPLGAEGIIDAPLPAALTRPTAYSRWGDSAAFLLFAGLILAAYLQKIGILFVRK